MLKINKFKFTWVFIMTALSTLISLIFVTMLAVYNNHCKNGDIFGVPSWFYYLALAIAISFCAIMLFMIFKRKSFKWYDFAVVAFIIALWFAATINYLTLCSAMQFPGDTKRMAGFFGIFLNMEYVLTYNRDTPLVTKEAFVNFEFLISILTLIVSSALLFINKKKLTDKAADKI